MHEPGSGFVTNDMRLACVLTLCAALAEAGEYAVLASGFRLRVDRHERSGAVLRLYSGGGVIEMAAESVVEFEAEERPAAPAPPAGRVELPAPAAPRDLIAGAAARNGLPPALVRSVAAAESGMRADAVSPKGAIGMMQLMPATARALAVDPYDPVQNVEAGARYLRELLIRYNGSVQQALAAYNAGPGAVRKYGGVPPYAETQAYIERVLGRYRRATEP